MTAAPLAAPVRVLTYAPDAPVRGRQRWCATPGHGATLAVAAIIITVNGNLSNRPACAQCALEAERFTS